MLLIHLLFQTRLLHHFIIRARYTLNMKAAKVCRCQVIYTDEFGCSHLFLPLFVDTLGVCHSCFEDDRDATVVSECSTSKFRANIGNTSPVVLLVSKEEQTKDRTRLMHSVLDELVHEVKERKKKVIISSILNQVLGSSKHFAEKIAVKEHDILNRELGKMNRQHFKRPDNLQSSRCKPKTQKSRLYNLQQPRTISF